MLLLLRSLCLVWVLPRKQEVGIKAMPTFMVFKNGEKVDTFVGADRNKLPVSHD